MINEKNKFLTVSWLSGLLSAEIFISTGEWGVQMPPLTAENSHLLRSGSQGATLVMYRHHQIANAHQRWVSMLMIVSSTGRSGTTLTIWPWAVCPMTWTRPDAPMSVEEGAPVFYSCGGQHKPEMCSERDSPLKRLYRRTHAKLAHLAGSGQLVWSAGCELSFTLGGLRDWARHPR